MGTINMGRVIGGGLLAGLVMNISRVVLHTVVLRSDGEAILADWRARGYVVQEDPKMIMLLMGITFVIALLSVYLYAAVRPRFGPGPRTAICAGLMVWALSSLFAGVYLFAGFPIFPQRIVWLPVGWALVEIPLATVIGAALYKEE